MISEVASSLEVARGASALGEPAPSEPVGVLSGRSGSDAFEPPCGVDICVHLSGFVSVGFAVGVIAAPTVLLEGPCTPKGPGHSKPDASLVKAHKVRLHTLIRVSGVVSGFTVIFILVAIGFALGRTQVLGEHAHDVLSRLVFFVCTPALLFTSLATSDLSVIFSSTLVIAGVSAFATGTLYIVLARGLLRRRDIPELTIGALSSSYVNSVNLGLPIAIFVLDDASFIAPLLLFQILIYSPLALGVLDVTALDRTAGKSVLRDTVRLPLTNPIVIGGLIGVVVSLIGWHPPTAILEPMKMLGSASVPAALLAFGMSLTGVPLFKKGQSPRREVALATVLKMLFMPALVYVIARWGFGESGHTLFAQVVIAALPTAQNVLVYATRYRRGQVLARDTALLTTLVSIPVIAVIAWLLA